MKIKVEIDEEVKAIEVLIRNNAWNEEVEQLMERLKERKRPYFVGRKDDMQHIFRAEDIICVFTEQDTIMVRTNQGNFEMRERLYELERDLPGNQFVRLSKSVIANLDELSRFEAYFNGTLCVYFRSGEKEYVSRHYVQGIKKAFQWKRKGL
ncbi:LytTR family DNA-binding domain-containing protein [Peribacillus muralis]|uniref:LytTR family DNA-binding domain-containing protein n=1 Tax=Peribacillus muralis TaxID=264697 RepID=UPI003D0110BB